MSFDVAQLAGGALGGAIATSVIGPWIAQGRERRDLSATVLQYLVQVEERRWANMEQPWEPFRDAVQGLRAAALIARAPRELVDAYLRLATVARMASEESLERFPAQPRGGSISVHLAELVDDVAARLTGHLWHPFRRRWSVAKDLLAVRAHEAKAKAANDPDDDTCFSWDVAVL